MLIALGNAISLYHYLVGIGCVVGVYVMRLKAHLKEGRKEGRKEGNHLARKAPPPALTPSLIGIILCTVFRLLMGMA